MRRASRVRSLSRCLGSEAASLVHLALGFIFSLKHTHTYVFRSRGSLPPRPSSDPARRGSTGARHRDCLSAPPRRSGLGLWERNSGIRTPNTLCGAGVATGSGHSRRAFTPSKGAEKDLSVEQPRTRKPKSGRLTASPLGFASPLPHKTWQTPAPLPLRPPTWQPGCRDVTTVVCRGGPHRLPSFWRATHFSDHTPALPSALLRSEFSLSAF